MVKNPVTDFAVPSELTSDPFSIQLPKLLLTLHDHTTREEASCCCCESNAFGLSPDGQLVTPAGGSDATGKCKRNSKAPLPPQLGASVILAALWICPWQYLSSPARTFYQMKPSLNRTTSSSSWTVYVSCSGTVYGSFCSYTILNDHYFSYAFFILKIEYIFSYLSICIWQSCIWPFGVVHYPNMHNIEENWKAFQIYRC